MQARERLYCDSRGKVPSKNTRRRTNAVLLLAHRLRQWTNNQPALFQTVAFAV